MSLGNRSLIEAVVYGFQADLNLLTAKNLTVMHCAAQSYQGYISLLILHKEHNFYVNVRDNFPATPLHFSILKQEFMNVQLLIKFGADVNA